LAETENTVKNLLIVLAGLSIKAKKAIKRVSILAGQLEKIFLSLVMAREKEAIIALRNEYTICRLTTLKVRDENTQTMKITY
jgi:hypothetical protein